VRGGNTSAAADTLSTQNATFAYIFIDVGVVRNIADGWEYYISRAEAEYRDGNFGAALQDGLLAQGYANTAARTTSIGIFIAKCYTALGDYRHSSQIYRGLIKEDTYIPPLLMGIMYNNLETKRTEKTRKNITLVKLFADGDGENGGNGDREGE
jgi:hypothetical protein